MDWILNDGGRAGAGFKGSAGDCVVRAIAIAAEIPYAEVYRAVAAVNATYRGRGAKGERSARNGTYVRGAAFKRYMASIGWSWTPTMRIGSGCQVHLVAAELPAGRHIVSLSRHYTAVVDGVIHDTHDPSRGGRRCVYGYWSKA